MFVKILRKEWFETVVAREDFARDVSKRARAWLFETTLQSPKLESVETRPFDTFREMKRKYTVVLGRRPTGCERERRARGRNNKNDGPLPPVRTTGRVVCEARV